VAGRARRGFTLFEVMAAVIVLGLLYSLLASSAIGGLRAEGTSRRRLEASLLADQTLYELEGQILLGSLPEIGSSEEELDEYFVTVNVQPFDPTPFLPQETEERDEPTRSLLDPPANADESLLRILEVVVSWSEGLDEYRVVRTTFAYDVAAVAPLLGSLDTSGGGGSGPDGADGADEAGRGSGGSTGQGRGSQPGGSTMDERVRKMLEDLRGASQ
jgi:prepilin-type N-terminal cleavage/methylation domain-containing protein